MLGEKKGKKHMGVIRPKIRVKNVPVGTFSVLFTTAGGAVHHREVFVLESEATRMRVHYIGSPPTHDEWVARDRFSLHLPSAVSHRRRQRRPEPRSNIVAGMRGRE